MHEIGMCEGLLDLIEKRADGRRIASLRVRVGARHAVVDQVFDQAFALVANGTAVQDAAVDLVIVPVTVTCRSCGERSESLDTLATCAHCGGGDVDISGGDDLVLESIRFESGGIEAAAGEGRGKGGPDVSRHSG